MALDKYTAETLIQVISILGYILSAFLFIAGVATLYGNKFIVSFVPELGKNLVGNLLFFVVMLIIVLSIFQFIVSKGISKHKNWARIAQIVISVFAVFVHFPVGTILGGCIIYLLAFDRTITSLFRYSK